MQAVSIHPCPAPGQGVHLWMYGATHALKRAGVPAREVESILRPLMTRREQPREIANTVAKVYSMPVESSSREALTMRRGQRGEDGRDPVTLPRRDLAHLGRTERPVRRPGRDPSLGVQASGEFVCTGGRGLELRHGTSRCRDQAREHALVHRAEPVQVAMGSHEGGEDLAEEREPVAERRFTVVEFDLRGFEWLDGFTRAAKLDYQARLHFHLSREFPLCLIVFSGNECARAGMRLRARAAL